MFPNLTTRFFQCQIRKKISVKIKMFMFVLKAVYYVVIIMSVLVSFYYVELYNKLLEEIKGINKKLTKSK